MAKRPNAEDVRCFEALSGRGIPPHEHVLVETLQLIFDRRHDIDGKRMAELALETLGDYRVFKAMGAVDLVRSAAPEMLALLGDLEWSGTDAAGPGQRRCCPDCGALQKSGHSPGCKLGALLARLPKEGA